MEQTNEPTAERGIFISIDREGNFSLKSIGKELNNAEKLGLFYYIQNLGLSDGIKAIISRQSNIGKSIVGVSNSLNGVADLLEEIYKSIKEIQQPYPEQENYESSEYHTDDSTYSILK